MRFILNFIFYGVLFYLIYLSFPEAFFTMVSWVDHLTAMVKELYVQLLAKFHEWNGHSGLRPLPPRALFITAFLTHLTQKVQPKERIF